MNKRLWVSAATLVAVVLIAGPAAGQAVYKKGSDIFVTPADGATRIDLSQYPVIETLFGSPPSPSLVPLKGKPIAGLGKTDTVVDRDDDLTLAVGQTGTSSAVLRGLSLVSQSPVLFNNEPWDLFVSVSPLAESVGTVTATRINQEGGSFNATLQVYPHLIFTRGNDVVTVDCGVSCDAITLTSTRAPWVSSDGGFSPSSAGVPAIPNGTLYDGNGDGIADDEFIGGSNFYPGFRPVAPYLAVIVSHDHPPVAEHEQEPNTQCAGSGSTEASVTPVSALCVAVADPVEPAEPTEPVVITGG